MKKYIFTIAALSSLFAFPVFAQSTSQTNISEKTTDATADMLAENVCHNYSSFIPKQIYECYERKDEKSSNFEKCILADTYVMFGLTHMIEKLSELGRPDVTKRAPFLQEYKYETSSV